MLSQVSLQLCLSHGQIRLVQQKVKQYEWHIALKGIHLQCIAVLLRYQMHCHALDGKALGLQIELPLTIFLS